MAPRESAACESCGGSGIHRSMLTSAYCWDCGGTGKQILFYPTGCPSAGTQSEPVLLVNSRSVPLLLKTLQDIVNNPGIKGATIEYQIGLDYQIQKAREALVAAGGARV